MTTSNGFAQQAPLYVRALRLRHLHVGGFVSFLLFECMIAAGVLLALAELVSWWAVPVLPAVVAIMVKVNDMVIGGSRRARAMARAADRGSSERASSTRVDSDDRTDDTPSVARRTTTTLDRDEIARAGRAARSAAGSGSASGSGSGSGSGAAVGAGSGGGSRAAGGATRTRTIEPPAQRKKVGVIKISLPAKDGGVGGGSRHSADEPRHSADEAAREVVDAGYGISPAVAETTADPAPMSVESSTGAHAAEGAYVAESAYAVEGAYVAESAYAAEGAYVAEAVYAADGSGAHAAGSTYVSGAYAEAHAAGDEWTDTDSHGFQRSRPLHPSEWSGDRPAVDPWLEQVAEPTHAISNDARTDWPVDPGTSTSTGGWDDRAAWNSAVSGNGQANWGSEAAWGDRSAWAEQDAAAQYGRGGQHASGEHYGYSSGQYAPAQQNAQDWDDETGFADQAAWRARSPYGSRGSWGTYGEWEPGAPDYVSDYTGENSASAYAEASREQAARDLAARGEAYRSGDSRTDDPYGWRSRSGTTGEHRRGGEDHDHAQRNRAHPGHPEPGTGDPVPGEQGYGAPVPGEYGYGVPVPGEPGYGEPVPGEYGYGVPVPGEPGYGEPVSSEYGYGEQGHGEHDHGERGHGERGHSEHGRGEHGHGHSEQGHGEAAPNREPGGRHARQQPQGRRRSEDTDNVTSGHFTTGRHADRGWRSDDDLARQRTGGINQGRFA
ncbi:hypothetical protein [Dactylosporangium sp. NPDC051541]|uniref:hypothetical protein n=1 Tax=Dactylosporangium sp. NPDC051541 TaxID=3363977 RepID=UPI0037B50869